VFLTAPPNVLQARVAARRGHFAPPTLVATQLDALEPPDDALTVDARLEVEEIVERICEGLGLPA
jgi:gluconokinase